jgi:hypothetical protein
VYTANATASALTDNACASQLDAVRGLGLDSRLIEACTNVIPRDPNWRIRYPGD